MLYIAIRFDLKFAGPVIVALLHDIVITVGVYSLTGREVSNATVAAVLTVLGYSIYDTIIIFDRIRENIPLMRRSPFATIANVSLWETIRRSLATTFITLLPVVVALLFGGATLKDFAFALIVGITSGAYSSIFIAAPLLTIWKEREPEYARRKGQEPERGRTGGQPARRVRACRAEAPGARRRDARARGGRAGRRRRADAGARRRAAAAGRRPRRSASAAGSGEARSRMAEPANRSARSRRSSCSPASARRADRASGSDALAEELVGARRDGPRGSARARRGARRSLAQRDGPPRRAAGRRPRRASFGSSGS